MRYSVKASSPGKVVRSAEPPREALAGDAQVSAYRAQIRGCLESEDFQGARKLLAAALREHPEEPALHKLERALAPPEVRAVPELDQDRTEELRWLEREGNAESYQGKWIALLGAQVVAVAETLKALLALLREKPPTSTPLIHKVG